MLLTMIRDLNSDTSLRSTFLSDPQAVLDQYKISSQDRQKLRSDGLAGVEKQLQAETSAILKELLQTLQPIVAIPWLEPTLDVQSIDPSSAPTGETVTVQVKGTGFAEKATLKFVRPDKTVRAKVQSVVTNPDGSTILTATARFKIEGPYDVIVTNPTAPQESGTLPMGFTATAG